jgi:hypothetical protein
MWSWWTMHVLVSALAAKIVRQTRLWRNSGIPVPYFASRSVDAACVCVCVRERERERRFFSSVMGCCRHGVRQLRTGWYDGVPYVTQCPLQQNASFTYR